MLISERYRIGRLTVVNIKKNQDKLEQFSKKMVDMGKTKVKTMKIGEYQKLEEALYIWFRQQREKAMPLTGPILSEKARFLFPRLYSDADKPFTASTGFLWRFCKRHGLKELKIQGEKESADVVSAASIVHDFPTIIEGYYCNKFFNCNETGLYYCLLLQKKELMAEKSKLLSYNECLCQCHRINQASSSLHRKICSSTMFQKLEYECPASNLLVCAKKPSCCHLMEQVVPFPFNISLSVHDLFLIRSRSVHPQLTLRSTQSLSCARTSCANREIVSDYFGKLASVCAKLNVLMMPMNIFNMDETGVTIVHKGAKVVTEIGRRNVWAITSGEKGKTHTIITAVSASGYVCSDSRWVNAGLFLVWLQFYVQFIPPSRPVLLILDGHSSRVNQSDRLCKKQQYSYALHTSSHNAYPPTPRCRSIQIFQILLLPLDVRAFKSFKSFYYKACKMRIAEHPNRVITTEQIASLVGTAWPQSLTAVNFMSGFKKPGIYPSTRERLQTDK